MKKILFILKHRELYGIIHRDEDFIYGEGLITGLLVSVKFVIEMLRKFDIDARLVVVRDNNDIDREVTKFKPHIVIIEALWVVPEKFKILTKLHPKVKWIVRLHSALPFIANEGIAMKWIFDYVKFPKVSVSCNDTRLLKELSILFASKFGWSNQEVEEKLLYQPNFYPLSHVHKPQDEFKKTIDIGCFGAVRPMKNQLSQAVAAIIFADNLGKKLYFHISGGRLEMKGDPVLHNLISLFKHFEDQRHKLIIHDWMSHKDFKHLAGEMDINMQVSLSETFNIVAADSVTTGVPLVASSEIFWSSPYFWANPNSTESMVEKLELAHNLPHFNVTSNVKLLQRFDHLSEQTWLTQIKKL